MTLCLSYLLSFSLSRIILRVGRNLDQSCLLSWWSRRIAGTGYEIEKYRIELNLVVARFWCCVSKGAGLGVTWRRKCCKGCSLCLFTSLELTECLFGVSL